METFEDDLVITVTVLVATRGRESLLPGCLASLLRQTLIDRTEILVIHGPGGRDLDAVRAFQPCPTIRCIPAPRPGLYVAWNTGIGEARGRYLATLNSDDRLRADALAVMAGALDAHPNVGLVYGDSLVTHRPDETFEHNSSNGRRLCWPEYSHRALLERCIFGPHPMWRRTVHESAGFFDETFESEGDYEFWLRLAERERMLHLPEPLGLYHENPDGLSRVSPERAMRERVRIVRRYLHRYRDIARAQRCHPSRTRSC
ncbi:MAG TPA: glycosyltransferase [Candidatus Methylomirabilis sp.]|nr:glycosyltransferase [Candidatus Methylomirabilis sp.]